MQVKIYVAHYGVMTKLIKSCEIESLAAAIVYFHKLNLRAIYDMHFAIKPCKGWQIVAEIEGNDFYDCRAFGEL